LVVGAGALCVVAASAGARVSLAVLVVGVEPGAYTANTPSRITTRTAPTPMKAQPFLVMAGGFAVGDWSTG
jgi:hypothetical protein